MLVEKEYKQLKADEEHVPDVPVEIAAKLESLRTTNSSLKQEIQTFEAELVQKQKLASNLEDESASLQKMITEAR